MKIKFVNVKLETVKIVNEVSNLTCNIFQKYIVIIRLKLSILPKKNEGILVFVVKYTKSIILFG